MILRSFKVLVACFLAPALLAAQQSEDRVAQAKMRLEQLQARLQLTPDQIEKLKPILRKEVEELTAVRDKYATDTSRRGRIKMGREMRGIQKKYEPQIAALLTPQQQDEWKKIKEERKEEIRKK